MKRVHSFEQEFYRQEAKRQRNKETDWLEVLCGFAPSPLGGKKWQIVLLILLAFSATAKAQIATFAGTGQQGYAGDGGAADRKSVV